MSLWVSATTLVAKISLIKHRPKTPGVAEWVDVAASHVFLLPVPQTSEQRHPPQYVADPP